MRLLSEASYRGLKDERGRIRRRVVNLQLEIQQMRLEAMAAGYKFETKPEVPAQPARIVMRKA